MDIKNRLFNSLPLTIVVFFAAATPVLAAERLAPADFKGIYRFSAAGLEFGKLGLEAKEDAGSIAMTSDVTTSGLARIFVKHSSHSSLDLVKGNGIYDSRYHTGRKARHVNMVIKNGIIVEELREPEDKPGTREPVSAELKKDANNPLAFILAMRAGAYAAAHSGPAHYSVLFYDGRRLTRGDFALKGRKTIDHNGHKTPVVAITARRTQVAGFSKSEQADADPKEPTLTIYFSDDERFIPIFMEAPLMIGRLAATLVHECGVGESCLLGIKD